MQPFTSHDHFCLQLAIRLIVHVLVIFQGNLFYLFNKKANHFICILFDSYNLTLMSLFDFSDLILLIKYILLPP